MNRFSEIDQVPPGGQPLIIRKAIKHRRREKNRNSKRPTAPDWDDFLRHRMRIPLFVYGREDIDVGPLEGFCRGHGGISGSEKSYHDPVGIYTAEGVYYTILIDTRAACSVPSFYIGARPFFYPIVGCFTVGDGLPIVDPATGKLRLDRRRP